MKITKEILKQLEEIGYFKVNSNPIRFSNGGGQFCGGYWEISLEEALESLKNAKQMSVVLKSIKKRQNS